MPTSFWDHPIETIEKVLHIRKQIEALQQSLREIYGDGTQPLVMEQLTLAKDGRKGKRSAATRVKMKAAQQARWAKKKPVAVKPVKAAKAKRTMSAASRKRMAAGQRARRTKEKIAPELSMPNKLVW
jgi:hypothetical protein